jgi:hypothetical protein
MERVVNAPFELMMVASLIGAVDVLYFHLYRFRLFEQPGSVAEELTHLARHLLFIAIVLTMLLSPPFARPLVLVLVGLDLLNNVADVLLEKSSREPLGGLPSAEYLIHILASMLVGMAISAFWWAPVQALSPSQELRGWVTVALGTLLFVGEGALFGRALRARFVASPAEVVRLER